MLKLRAILFPILTVCMLTQPFCAHCFAQIRTMVGCAESMEQKVLEIDAESFPPDGNSICTKKPCLSTPKIELDVFQKVICAWHVFLPGEAISPCVTSADTDIFFGDSARCPAWLRLSVLLI